MDLHNRYLHFSTLNISALQTASDKVENVFVVLHRLIQVYNHEMVKEKMDLNKLEIFRMLLCHEYQLLFNDIEKKDDKRYISDAKEICFPNIEMIFSIQYSRNPSEILILRDIFILQMVLYHNTELIKRHLQDFLSSSNAHITNSNTRVMYMKILVYFLESLHLRQFLYNDTSNSEEDLKDLGFMYVEVIKSWMKVKEDAEWRLFTSMLPMLMKTFSLQYVLFPLWHYILNEISDLKESLIVLSIMADICFTPLYSTKLIYIYDEIYNKDTFWILILMGLRSSLQQYRKQALYIMKKTINSVDKVCIQNLGKTKAPITPFMCNKSHDADLPIKQKFFLVYEALEEKQHHLVAPALTHVASLVKANKSCDECFNVVWLQCIFEKILRHENNNIAKWGTYQICKLDNNMFNDEFLELFVSALNNTFLYECQLNEECPEIVKELSAFLECAMEGNLLNKFFEQVSRATWNPVAIFYMMHTLRTISYEKTQHANWQANELNAIGSLIKTNLNMHSHVLRTASQIELLRAIPKYVQKVNNLILLANTLAAFPADESLIRGTLPWNDIIQWLQKTLIKMDAIAFVQDTCARYLMYEDTCHEVNLRTFALMIYLLYDADLILSFKTCPARKALDNWLCILNGIEVRPYADMRSGMDVVEFISHLMNFSSKTATESSDNVIDLISLHVRISFKFLIKHMRKTVANFTYENYTRYITVASIHIANANLFMLQKDVISYTEQLQSASIRLLENIEHQNMQYLYGLHVLHLSQDILVSPAAKDFYIKYLLNIQMNPANISNDADTMNLKGKITSEYCLLLLKLLRQYLVNSPTHSWHISIAALLNILLQFLELGGTEIISEIAMILNIIIDNKAIVNADDQEALMKIFKLCWRCIFAKKKNNIFWTVIENLMAVIINDNFFLLPNAIEFMTEYIDQLIKEGDNTPRFKRIILSKINGLSECNLMQLEKPLLSCLLHGSVLRRDKKVENHAHLFIAKHLVQYYSKHILALNYNNDTAIRAQATVLLHRIISDPELNYAAKIIPLILKILEKYKNKRYFNDSYIHKLKHRLMQVLLLLEPVLNEELVVLLQEKLRNLIFSESNQHSVRLMQEWLMIRIFRKNINLHHNLWKFFAESIEKRPGCTISVASIVYHVARLLSNNNQKIFIRAALPYLAQCCLGQQYNIRLYNQFILVQLCKLMSKIDGNDIISEYNGIYQAAVTSLQQGNTTKNAIKMQNDFYFCNFHPIKDYSLQTIFFELPRLTNVSCDEWITPNLFEAFRFERNNSHPLQLYNIDSFLTETRISIYLTKSLADDINSLTNIETYLESLHDIQKKIDPLKTTASLYNEIFEEMKESICQQDLQLYEKNLIVVATFVNRPPNLGGIARTCEVFGVTALVLANLDCVKDKEFQCLSVSAEKWINILQVKPHELREYLLEKKNAGWSLIGAEQTANSVNLLETRFKKKTVLILGNEKDGIPANFIPLFDTCVEIPQVGVIRSLNVHVTAAICIWQYASQHTLK